MAIWISFPTSYAPKLSSLLYFRIDDRFVLKKRFSEPKKRNKMLKIGYLDAIFLFPLRGKIEKRGINPPKNDRMIE